MKTVLVVDDKENVRTLVRDYLKQEGFRVVVAENGKQALYSARQEKPDLILLDIMMPEMSGYEFISAWRKEKNTPIILITAKLEESDKVLGLELGADDYLTKPFGMRELVARIHAVLRRASQEATIPEIIQSGEIILDRGSHEVTVASKKIDLSPSEFELLAILMSVPGRVFTRMELLEKLQGTSYEGLKRNIDVHVCSLRGKIEKDERHPRYIETVYGVGYRFRKE
jgi:two-component system alkaline phosphatase synthesis response regulator PhoP